jgi:hypothetical protein
MVTLFDKRTTHPGPLLPEWENRSPPPEIWAGLDLFQWQKGDRGYNRVTHRWIIQSGFEISAASCTKASCKK